MHRWLLPLLLLLVAASGASAQEAAVPLDPGVRVRVTLQNTDSARVTGSVLAMSWDSLVIAESPTGDLAREWTSIRLVEVSEGRSRRWSAVRGATWGAFLGVAAGTISGALAAKSIPYTPGESMALGGVGLGLVGSTLGAGVGALFVTERWRPYVAGRSRVPPPPPLPPAAPVEVAAEAQVTVDPAAPAPAPEPTPEPVPVPEPAPVPAQGALQAPQPSPTPPPPAR